MVFVILAAFSLYVTLYTISAYQVANRWAFDGNWLCSGGVTFFPWPRGPQGVYVPIITKMNPMDEFIHLYLIKTGVLVFVCLVLWLVAAVYFFRAVLPLIETWRTSRRHAGKPCQIFSRACFRSAIMSSASSMPRAKRTSWSVMPSFWRCSGVMK